MLTIHDAWKKNVLRLMRNGNSLQQAASIAQVGMDKIITEKKRDPKFQKDIADIHKNRKRQLQY